MLEVINPLKSKMIDSNSGSLSAREVSQFMKNFFEALKSGNTEEVETYYADEMNPISLPSNTQWHDKTILVDDHLATFACALESDRHSRRNLLFVLDKSEGFWQIIHGEIQTHFHSH